MFSRGGYYSMRSRAPVALLACLAGLCATPAAASAAAPETLAPYSIDASPSQVADLSRAGLRHRRGWRRRATTARSRSTSSPRRSRSTRSSRPASRSRRCRSTRRRRSPRPLGDSPNPYFNVYRSYMEAGGIADEMRAIAKANPDVMKLEQIGTSTLGKPILAIKMTENARSTPDGTRPAMLFSAVNHAREWIAAEMGRRLPGWFAAHKNDTKIRELIKHARAVVPADPESGRLRLHVHLRHRHRAGDVRLPRPHRRDNRFWRKTLRDNDANGIYGNNQDGVDPNRNYPAKRGIDEEGASNIVQRRDLPRPVPAVGAREPRRRPPAAARQVHRQHQLPLRGPAAADAGFLHDRLLPARLDDLRRDHRHRRRRGRVPVPLAALVGPLRVQRRHDRQRVHELRHHRLDAGDGHVRDARRAQRLQPVRFAG